MPTDEDTDPRGFRPARCLGYESTVPNLPIVVAVGEGKGVAGGIDKGRPAKDAVGIGHALRPQRLGFRPQLIVRAGEAQAQLGGAVSHRDFQGNIVAVLPAVGEQGPEGQAFAAPKEVPQLPLQAVAVAARRLAAVVFAVDYQGKSRPPKPADLYNIYHASVS